MDVAVLSNVVYPFVEGGAQKRIHEVGRRLADRGHDVTVYGRHYWDGPRERRHEGMTLRAVAPARDLYVGDRRSIREAVDFAVRAAPALARRVGDHDIVDASVFPHLSVVAARVACRRQTPLVTTWHEVWDDYWHDYLGGIGGLAGRGVERLVARLPQHPVAVSETTADRLADLGVDRSRVAVVPNGVDVDRIRSVDLAPDADRVLYAGRLAPAKNVDTLLRAFAAADADTGTAAGTGSATPDPDATTGPETAPDREAGTTPDGDAEATDGGRASTAGGSTDRAGDATLGIVGDGPERARLESLADRLGIADRVRFHGFLDDSEAVIARMRAADVFVSASTREGFGMAVLEAMAAGCTVVAVDAPESAAAEVVGDGGLLAGPSVPHLARALERALAGERPAADPVAVARQYDWDAVADRAASVYRSVLAARS